MVPRFVSMPALLVASAVMSVMSFAAIESWLVSRTSLEFHQSSELPRHRARLLASFVSVNIFFWFADPTLGLVGPKGGQLIRSGILIASGMWLYRGWFRDMATYARESASTSLRKQLDKRFPLLGELLEGRSLKELSPHEVFTLAKVLPGHILQSKKDLYRGVIFDLLESGRIDRATSLLQLEELRQSLGLHEDDHHQVLQEYSKMDPHDEQPTSRDHDPSSLRLHAAAEALATLLSI